jgi:succinate-semialdehyde dehydrogenase/glutarate-semialdehyde dehydrogenase
MRSVNPANEQVLDEYPSMEHEEITSIVERANKAQQEWSRTSFSHRAEKLNRIAGLLRNRKHELAELMAREMGKPLPQGISEAEKCAWVCEYYAENAEWFLQQERIETDASKSYVTFNPLGTVLAVMPWNFPFWQLFRFAAPALMAGNGAVLKHASNVPGCALEIEAIIHEGGIPEDLFRTLLIGSDKVQSIIEHPGIAAVTLTGSTGAGKAVAAQAGKMLKKTVLELGGSDPYVVLEDADLDKTVETCVASRLINSGQSCIAAKRFIVVENVYDEFLNRMKQLMQEKKVGDPFDEATDIGPMATSDLRDELHQQVQTSIDKGATCVLGGEVPDGDGAYYLPTILTNVKPGMPAYEEELFGPVAIVIKVSDEDEAIAVANDTQFGLGAAVFSENVRRAEEIAANKLEAGCCFVNAFVRSDPRLPFGGIKQSGYGRELAHYGIKEFMNIKTVYVA